MTDRISHISDSYHDIFDRCLADEDKAKRDAVLAELTPEQRAIVQRMLKGIARRLSTFVAGGQGRDERRERLEGIREPWLRERVEVMVRERFAQRRTS